MVRGTWNQLKEEREGHTRGQRRLPSGSGPCARSGQREDWSRVASELGKEYKMKVASWVIPAGPAFLHRRGPVRGLSGPLPQCQRRLSSPAELVLGEWVLLAPDFVSSSVHMLPGCVVIDRHEVYSNWLRADSTAAVGTKETSTSQPNGYRTPNVVVRIKRDNVDNMLK